MTFGKQTDTTLGVTKMSIYRVTLVVDEGWLRALNELTDVEILEGETMRWINTEEITNG